MNSSKLFEQSKQQIESAFEEFDDFYVKMQGLLKEREFSPHELSIVKEIQEIINDLEKGPKNSAGQYVGYKGWDGDTLTRADGRLATLMFNLGGIASEKVQKANVYGR